MTISAEEIQQLRSRFALKAHSIRQGNSNKAKTKSQWFVYLDKIAIIDRLDEVFPGEWEYKMTEPQLRATHYSAIGSLTIRGVTREFNGTQSLGGFNPENDEKGCGTDVFRRAASMWGIGSYINDAPNMWTAFPAKGDWDAQRKYEGEAKDMFNRWFNGSAPPAPQHPTAPESNGQAPTVTAWPVDRIDKLFAHWVKQGLSESDILRFAGIADKYSEQWNKYASNQDVSGAIQRAHNAEMDGGNTSNMPDNTEHSATFTHMMYVGKYSNMQFATKPDGSDNNTYAICYGGRGAIKKWNAELYEQLQLEQFDAIKGKNIVSDFVKMVVPVDFRFVSEGKGDDAYFKVVGIVGDPVIPF